MRIFHSHVAVVLSALALSCGGSTTPEAEEPMPDANDPSYAASFDGTVDPRVSTSAGEEGGFVVLWPRVVTAAGTEAFEGGEVQAALRSIVERVAEGAPIDVRPEPERACPQSGCAGTAVGAVLLKSGSACAVVATVSRAGPTQSHLVTWVGEVELANHNVPFREPPEQHINVRDFLPCAELGTALSANEPDVEALIVQSRP